MSRNLALVPFTMYEPSVLGGQLNKIVVEGSAAFEQDFPHLSIAYSSPDSSSKRVEAIQRHMRENLQFVALAVVADGQQVIGVTTFLQRHLPTNVGEATGPLMSIWLNPNRPDELRRIGSELMEKRLLFALGNAAFSGYLWTIIRPANHLSQRIWSRRYGVVAFQKVDDPRDYAEVDGHPMPVLRQLFASTHSLEALRSFR